MTEELTPYIAQEIDAGTDPEKIKADLLTAGWDESIIDEAMHATATAQPASKKVVMLFGILVLLGALLAALLYFDVLSTDSKQIGTTNNTVPVQNEINPPTETNLVIPETSIQITEAAATTSTTTSPSAVQMSISNQVDVTATSTTPNTQISQELELSFTEKLAICEPATAPNPVDVGELMNLFSEEKVETTSNLVVLGKDGDKCSYQEQTTINGSTTITDCLFTEQQAVAYADYLETLFSWDTYSLSSDDAGSTILQAACSVADEKQKSNPTSWRVNGITREELVSLYSPKSDILEKDRDIPDSALLVPYGTPAIIDDISFTITNVEDNPPVDFENTDTLLTYIRIDLNVTNTKQSSARPPDDFRFLTTGGDLLRIAFMPISENGASMGVKAIGRSNGTPSHMDAYETSTNASQLFLIPIDEKGSMVLLDSPLAGAEIRAVFELE